MKPCITLCLLITLSWYIICTAPKELTNDDFQNYINDHDIVMVKFYAPWCGHCKAFAPEYEKAVDLGENHAPPFYLVNVDATVQKKLAERFEIQGFPTIKLFLKGRQPINYDGERKAEDVIKFIEKKTGPASLKLDTIENLLKEKKANEVIVVFGGDPNSPEFAEYANAASAFEDIKFFHTTIAILKEAIQGDAPKQENKSEIETNVTNEANETNETNETNENGNESAKEETFGRPMLVLFKNFDEKIDIFEKNFDAREISKFIDTNHLPILLPITQKTIQAVFSKGTEGMFLFIDSNKDNSLKIEEDYVKLAKNFKGSFAFFKSGIKGDLESRFANFLKIKEEDLPRLEILKPDASDISRYLFNQKNYEQKSFEDFLNDYRNNKIERYFKSEEIPKEQESAVLKVVGKTWRSLVLDNDKDVLVKFYAPWCGHCKELAPKYIELAQQMKKFENIVIAEVDATENDIPGMSIRSFPTLKFFPSKSKNNPLEYTGDRSIDAMKKFIREKSSFPIELDIPSEDDNARYDL